MRGRSTPMQAWVSVLPSAYLPDAFRDRKRNATGPELEADSTRIVLVPSGGVRSSQLYFRKQRTINWQRRPAGWPSNSCVPGLRGEGRTPGTGRWCRVSAMPRASNGAPRVDDTPHSGRLRPDRRSAAPLAPLFGGASGIRNGTRRMKRPAAQRAAGTRWRQGWPEPRLGLPPTAASAPGKAADRTDTSGPPRGGGRRNMAYWALQ